MTLFRRIVLSVLLGFAWLGSPVAAEEPARTLHVSVGGNDRNPGTEARPLASIAKAVELLGDHQQPCEIVMHEGIYRGDAVSITARRTLFSVGGGSRLDEPRARLTIRAARRADGTFHDVILDGSRPVSNAEPVVDAPGVFRVSERMSDYYSLPAMWEADSRTRYTLAADLEAVKRFPATFWYDAEAFYFHTSDGRPPKANTIARSVYSRGLSVSRSDVTVRGLQFHSFGYGDHTGGLVLNGARNVAEDCRSWNCQVGFIVAVDSPGIVIRRCRTDDCAMGVYVKGIDTLVEDCRLFRHPGDFAPPASDQNETAIEFYFPAVGGTVRRNLVVGFPRGIFIKAVPSPVVVEHNTLVDIAEWGFGCISYDPKSVFRHNIVTGAQVPMNHMGELKPGVVVEYNGFWDLNPPKAHKQFLRQAAAINTGVHTIYADPLFAGPAVEDYRLLPQSSHASAGPGGKPIGAFSVAVDDFIDRQPPRVRVEMAPPARKSETAEVDWIVPAAEATLQIEAVDAFGKATRMRFQIDDGPWSRPELLSRTKRLMLPDTATLSRVRVRACDDAGNWSEPTELRVRIAARPPQYVTPPVVYAGKHGAIVSFVTDRPCQAELSCQGATFTSTARTHKDGTVVHHIALDAEAIGGTEARSCRLTLSDEVGNKAKPVIVTIAAAGPARTWYVSLDGTDADGCGGAEAPWRTLQFAVDRALPGDTIRVQPGLYAEPTTITRGGRPGAPITLQSTDRWKAILDMRKDEPYCVLVENAPHVVIDGFEVRWFHVAGIGVLGSPHVTVRNCRVWNDYWFGRVRGRGLYAMQSPDLVIERNVMFRCDNVLTLHRSPRARITYNTLLGSAHGCLDLAQSLAGTVVRNNSLAFGGNNEIYKLRFDNPDDLKSFDCDYNNLGLTFRTPLERERLAERGISVEGRQNLERGEDGPRQYGLAKGLAFVNGQYSYSLRDWRALSGQDKHSIFAHPKYVDLDGFDLRLRPDSPNIGAGENGTTIGALGRGGE